MTAELHQEQLILLFLDSLSGQSVESQARAVFTWALDNLSYQQEDEGRDEWLTPAQSLERGHIDCEDYALFWYACLWYLSDDSYTLRLAHIKDDKFRDHMVLIVKLLDGKPLVLDNLFREIQHNEPKRILCQYDESGVWVGNPPRLTMAISSKFNSWLERTSEMPGFESLMPDMSG